jgi:hypothetical protein
MMMMMMMMMVSPNLKTVNGFLQHPAQMIIRGGGRREVRAVALQKTAAVVEGLRPL